MRASEIRRLIQLKPVELNAARRRLSACHDIHELRKSARRVIPRPVFDYVDGAADEELSMAANVRAFRRWQFQPRALTGITTVDTATRLLDRDLPLPLVMAPTGYTRMMHPAGEIAVARAAQRHGLPYTLSTMATTTIEDVAAAAPDARRWFQLYLWRDRAYGKDLVERAAAAGYDTLMLTVDTPVGGARLRDVRNGLTIPPALSLRTFVDGAMHPHWWFNMLTTDPLTFASLESSDGTVSDMINRVFDPALTMADVEWLRGAWPGKLVIKGIQSVADAVRVTEAGADAVLLSNHGGRQLDRAPVPLELVAPTVEALDGRAEVLVDTGIMHGADVLAAIALGARAALIGRAYLYGLMAGGQTGVEKAITILTGEMVRTLQLIGLTSVDQLRPEHVRIRPNG